MKKDWLEFHVEPIEAEDEEYYVAGAKRPHRRAIWRGIDLKTMHNDEVHGCQRSAESSASGGQQLDPPAKLFHSTPT